MECYEDSNNKFSYVYWNMIYFAIVTSHIFSSYSFCVSLLLISWFSLILHCVKGDCLLGGQSNGSLFDHEKLSIADGSP